MKKIGDTPAPMNWSADRLLQLWLKRVFLDIPFSAGALLVLSPLLLAVFVAIRTESNGPALFRQKRVGLAGHEFWIWKFRSMRFDACDDSGQQQTVAEDGRVTKVGRFLRATSVDELPQLWNILIGDMAIIGPRPMVKAQLADNRSYTDVVPYYDYRHSVKPGLSGWAQANGYRGPTTDVDAAIRRIDHDCAYVQNLSLWLDLKIIVKTIYREFLTGSGI